MRSKLLISTAALLAGVALASAQNMPGGGRESGGAQSPGAQSQGAPAGAAAQERQSPRGNASERGQSRPDQAQQDRTMQRGQKEQTTGQAPQRGHGADQQGQREGSQSPQRQQGQQGQSGAAQGQTGAAPQGQSGQGQARQQGQGGGGNVTLTTEQRTKIRQTVLTGGNAPRVSKVNFSLSVGTAVPTSVHVVTVPQVIVDIHPEWRGYLYFVVGDQIIIVDRGHRIVAVLAV